MDFCVKGITFKYDDLQEVSVESLSSEQISKGHIFYMIESSKKCLLLLRAGEIVSEEFINKYKSKNVETLLYLSVVEADDLTVQSSLWERLKNVRNQKEQIKIKDEILLKFMEDNTAESDLSILNFVISCHDEFYKLPKDLLIKYQEQSYQMFTRSQLLSAFSVLSAMAHDICDYDFLSDFYNIAIFLDYGLVESGGFNYMLSQACETERLKPGQGESFLELNTRTNQEIGLFKDHPNKSARFLNEHKDKFTHKELIEFVKYHHEKIDGTGFPQGLYYSALSQSEMLLAFCDNLVPFEEHIFKKGDGYDFVSMYFENLNTLSKSRMIPISGIINTWKGLINWKQKKGEQA